MSVFTIRSSKYYFLFIFRYKYKGNNLNELWEKCAQVNELVFKQEGLNVIRQSRKL